MPNISLPNGMQDYANLSEVVRAGMCKLMEDEGRHRFIC